jgi:hypothetical protein
MFANRTGVDDILVMLLRTGIYRRHDQSDLRKRKLVTGDSTMTGRDNGLNRRKILDIRIGRLVEAHIAAADLQKNETLLLYGHCLVDDTERVWHRDRRKYAGSRPGHASFKQNEQRLATIETPLQG